MTMSKWERDVLYPAWKNQPKVTEYLGFNPFTDPVLRRPLGNGGKHAVSNGNGLQMRILPVALRLANESSE